MFSKLKHLKDLRSQAKTMQDVLSGEIITIDNKGVKIEMNGNMEIININITDNIAKESLETIIKDNINDATKKTQKIMAQKMQEMGGFPGLN